MITKFKIFESRYNLSDELKDIFQDLELDYPDIEISVGDNWDRYPDTTTSQYPFVSIDTGNIQKIDLSFANDLCDYINKCFNFGFKIKSFVEIFVRGHRYTMWDIEDHVFKSGKDLIDRLDGEGKRIFGSGYLEIAEDRDPSTSSLVRKITFYFYK